MADQTNPSPENNIICGKELYSQIIEQTGSISDLLQQFCGPYAMYASSPRNLFSISTDEFTRDGISIILKTGYSSPVFQFCRNLIGYIGEKVDNVCHDGTTTSMLFASSLANNLVKAMIDVPRIRRRAFTTDVINVLKRLDTYSQNSTVTVEDLHAVLSERSDVTLDQVKHNVALWAAMTSSKGDVELSEAVAETVLSYPPQFYDHARVRKFNVERKERIVVEDQTANFSFPIMKNISSQMGNSALGFNHDYPEAYITTTGLEVHDGCYQSACLTKAVADLIDGHVALDRPWVILTADLSRGTLLSAIGQYNRTEAGAKFPIVPVSFQFGSSSLTGLMAKAIPIIAGEGQYFTLDAATERPLTGAHWMVPCSLTITGHTLEIDNLYEKDGEYVHPFYNDPSKEEYHEFLRGINTVLKNNQDRKAGASEDEVDKMYHIKRCVTSQRIKDLFVAGLAHENESNVSAATDAVGSACSVLENGFVLSNYVSLLRTMLDIQTPTPAEKVVRDALERVVAATYGFDEDNYRTPSRELAYEGATNKYCYVTAMPDGTYDIGNIIDDMKADTKTHPIVQPIKGFAAQLMRIADIVPKLAQTYAVMPAD